MRSRLIYSNLSIVLMAAAATACSGKTENHDGGNGGAPSPGNGGAPSSGNGGAPSSGSGGSGNGAAGPISTNSWTSLGRGLSSTYVNPEETRLTVDNVASLHVGWEKPVAGGVTGAAAISGDVAYVLGTAGMFAFDVKTGAEIWQNADVGGSSSPTYEDGVVYVSATMGGEIMYALDAKTGAEKWHTVVDTHQNAVGWSSPVLTDKYVVLGDSSFEENFASDNATFRGAVVAFDKKTGAEAWRYYTVDPPFNGCAVWSTVSIDLAAKTVFAVTGNNYTENPGPTSDSVFALSLDTGAKLWQKQASTGDVYTIVNPKSPDSDFGSNPILFESGGKKLVGLGQKSGDFWTLDRATGEAVWKRNLGGGSSVGGILNNGAYDGERILVAVNAAKSAAEGSEASNGDTFDVFGSVSTLFALDPATGDIFWERQLPAFVWAPITIANGVGFVAAETTLQAFDVKTGKKLFEHKVAGTIASAPVVVDGRVFFGSGMQLVVFGHRDNVFHVLTL